MQPTQQEIKQRFKNEYYENKICADVGQVLQRHYPDWRWWVECILDTGVFTVRNLDLHGDYGFYVPLGVYLTNPERHRLVMRKGGEILERYDQGRKRRPEVIEVERDIKGNGIGEHN